MSDLDEELLAIAGKRGGKRSKRARSDSDDWDDDEEDSESEEKRKPAKKRASARGRAAAPRKPKRKQEEDDDDDDDDGDDSDDSEFEEKLAGMTELEREMALFDRDEKRAREREKKKAIKDAHKEKAPVEVRASSRRARATTGADSAIDKLTAARQQREKRAARRKEEEEGEEEEEEEPTSEGKDEEEEEEEEDEEGAAEPSSEQGDGAGGEGRRFGARGARAYDEGQGDDEEEEEEEEPADLAAVLTMQLKRDMLEAWHDKPFFDDAVKGCVVRMAFGTYDAGNGVQLPNYMLMRVVDAVEKHPYRFTQDPSVRTPKWLVLEETGVNRSMQMSMVSTKDITQEELDRWNRHCDKANARKITRRDAAAAAAQIAAAKNYKFTKEDIQRKLAAKREKGEVVGALVTEKARLRGLLEAAESAGDLETAVQHRARLEELEASQAAARRAAADGKGSMAGINARNKQINFEKALKNVGNRPDGEAGHEGGGFDVFSRRQTQSKVYWNTKDKKKPKDGGGGEAGGGTPEKGQPPPPQQQAQKQQQQQQVGAGGAAATRRLSRTMSAMDPTELISLLGIEVDESLLPGGGAGGPEAAAAAAARRMLGGGRWQLSDAAQALEAGLAANPKPLVPLAEWRKLLAAPGGQL